MSTAGWRRLLVGLGVFGFIQLGIIIWMNVYVHGADAGIGTTATSPFNVTGSATETPFVDRLTVATGSSSYRAGLRTGDSVDLPAAVTGGALPLVPGMAATRSAHRSPDRARRRRTSRRPHGKVYSA